MPSVVDNVIREWLKARHTRKRKTQVWIDTLFNRAIDAGVQALSYVDFQNKRKIGKRARTAISSNSPQPTSSAAMQKLALARYRDHKRKKRAQEKNTAKYQVHILIAWMFILDLDRNSIIQSAVNLLINNYYAVRTG